MTRLLITLGGSHRKLQKQAQAFKANNIPIRFSGASSLGAKTVHAVIPDTVEARTLLKAIGGSIARNQWEWLKDEVSEF